MDKISERKLAVIMFTDIVGYTSLVRENEDNAYQQRNRYRQVLEAAHERFKGEIKQYLGDGSLSLFQSSLQAVKCAVSIQAELMQHPTVDLRIGIHSGEIVLDNDGVFGDAVNIASRVESFGVSGSVLISESIFEQLKNQPSINFKPLGEFNFKNVNKPVQLYAIDHTGITVPRTSELKGKGSAASEKPFKYLPRLQNNLLGREKEVDEISEIIQRKNLVTLSGTGGTGKTSLAITIANKLVNTFRDGVFWISLAQISDSNSVVLAIAQTLELIQNPSKDPIDQVIQFLNQKEALLVLDNFEQIVSAAPLIQQILDNCHTIKILVTSRIILNLLAEQEYPVAPLAIPLLGRNNNKERLLTFASVDLFSQRARDIHPHFELNDQNAVDVAKICIRLDGLPLAIELAAARVKLFTPKTLLDRLDSQLDLLKSSNVNRPSRHQTLRQMISWSYNLLPNDEKKLFHRLSVFSGGCSLEAIEAVCLFDEENPMEALDKVIALVNKSLLQRKEMGSGEPRFYLLETIRAFALEALSASEDDLTVREAHVSFFLEKVERIQPKLTGSDSSHLFESLERDLDNFRDAINSGCYRKEFGSAFRICAALYRLWTSRGMLTEGVKLTTRLLQIDVPERFLKERVKVSEALGVSYFYTTEYNKAVPVFREILAFWKTTGETANITNVMNHLGFACGNVGMTEEGIQLSQEALKIYTDLGHLRGQAVSYNNLGWTFTSLGDPRLALGYFKKGLNLRKSIQDLRGVAFATINLAWANGMLGNQELEQPNFNYAHSILRDIRDKIILSWGLILQAFQLYELNRIDDCMKCVIESDSVVFGTGGKHTVGLSHYVKGLVACLDGDYGLSQNEIERGIQILSENGSIFHQARGWQFESQVLLSGGNIDDSLASLKRSLNMNHKYGCKMGLAENVEQAGLIYHYKNDFEKASLFMAKSCEMRIKLGTPIPPIRIIEIEEARASIKEKIEPPELQDLGVQGVALTIEEAISKI